MIVDSHCHLDYLDLYNQLDEVVKRANDNNIKRLLTICTTLESFEKIKIITNKYKNIYGTFGIHPHETKKYQQVDSKFILDIKKRYSKIVGIGETGLDFYYNHSDKEIQKKSFIEHINAASELNIPVIVHTRNAEIDTYEILKSESKNSNLKVLIHCFTGTKDFAKKLVDLNFYISVSGIITFKKTDDLAVAISSIPIENLLVETDSPYLAPLPHRGKYNEPSYIIHTIKKLSEIKKLPDESIMLNTTNNFMKLFNLA
jgi:TatD DNase family protein